MLVVLHHSHPYFAGISHYSLPSVFETVLQNADKGVTLFFVLSAYTLCLSLGQKKDAEAHPLRNYFLRRGFRIIPLYYIAIFVILIANINHPSASSLAANFLFIHGFSPYWINSTVPGGWSVGIEVIFYLIFPLIFFRIRSVHQVVNITLTCMLIAKLLTSLMSRYLHISDMVSMGVLFMKVFAHSFLYF